MDLEVLQKSTKNLKILYVEDSMMMRKVTTKMLGNFFGQIDTAQNGAEAFELYKKFYDENNNTFYDIVITDLEMPVMDGEELSQKILEFNFTQEVIVLSSVGEFTKLVNLMNMGVNKFISKPIEEEQLAQTIEQVYQNIYIRQLQEKEKLEVEEYNRVLKQKEDEQQKLIDAKAKELEEFSYALDISAIVAKTDVHGEITYVNKQYCKISKYDKEELVGQNISIINSGRRPSSYFKKLWNTINDKKTYKSLFENKTKEGNVFYIETTITPIVNIEGEIVEFIAVSHDMTQLVQSLEEVKKAKQEKEDFFMNISHEMKTPLNSILGFSALLKKRLVDDEKSLLMANTIHETGEDLNKLVDSILDMRKIQDNTLKLLEVAFNPHDEIDKYVKKYLKDSFEKKQKYETYIDSKLPTSLLGDPARITQVIGIIIDNAIKFTPENGEINVNVEYDTSNELLIVQVKDTGIGISKEDQGKIFTLQQLDASASRSHEGAGLGLNIAYNLVKTMKGSIVVKSIPTKGSLFEVKFPLKK